MLTVPFTLKYCYTPPSLVTWLIHPTDSDDILQQMVFLSNSIDAEEGGKKCMSNEPPGFEDPHHQTWFTELSRHLLLPASAPMSMVNGTTFPLFFEHGYRRGLLKKMEEGEDVDVHLYRFQVIQKVSHLHAVKRFFRLPKTINHLGLCILKTLLFTWKLFRDSDMLGTTMDRRSTSGGCLISCRRTSTLAVFGGEDMDDFSEGDDSVRLVLQS
ncbi:hypothetical protein Tco_1124184 [Tanacetum coccineum]|uniref:Uncharacterized protein n=1 Tax=Tanacetum coccineum TaxID=301880 RepID=A0ABQ5J9C3_9ASTR